MAQIELNNYYYYYDLTLGRLVVVHVGGGEIGHLKPAGGRVVGSGEVTTIAVRLCGACIASSLNILRVAG